MSVTLSKDNRPLSDSEIEAELMPYADAARKYQRLFLLFFAVAMLIFITGAYRGSAGHALLGLIPLAAGVVFSLRAGKEKRRYDELFRQYMGGEIEEMLAAYFGPQLEPRASEDGGSAVREEMMAAMRHSGLFPGWNRFQPDSYRKGIWKGMGFEAFNAHLTEEESTPNEDGGVTTTEIFNGIWLLCEIGPSAGKEPVIVTSKSLGPVGNAHRVLAGDAAFDALYHVRAESPEAAAALLTEQRIARLVRLHAVAEAGIAIRFENGRATVALNGKHRFQDLAGTDSTHLENIRQNLRASLAYTAEVLDCFV